VGGVRSSSDVGRSLRRPVRNDAHQKGVVSMWWLPAVSLLALGTLLYVASALSVLSFSPLVVGRQEAARDDAVRAALARHGEVSTAGNERAAPTIQLLSGGHPGAAPLDVPVPPDALMPDARTRDDERAAQLRDRAMMVTGGDLADVLAFYRDELPAQGWHEVQAWMSRPAQGAPGPGGAVSVFCRGVDTPALLIGVVSPQSGPSELRLIVDPADPGLCASSVEPTPRDGLPPQLFVSPL
jgi:hypothetical protein